MVSLQLQDYERDLGKLEAILNEGNWFKRTGKAGEIEDANWFKVLQLPKLPSKISIARRLIDAAVQAMRGSS